MPDWSRIAVGRVCVSLRRARRAGDTRETRHSLPGRRAPSLRVTSPWPTHKLKSSHNVCLCEKQTKYINKSTISRRKRRRMIYYRIRQLAASVDSEDWFCLHLYYTVNESGGYNLETQSTWSEEDNLKINKIRQRYALLPTKIFVPQIGLGGNLVNYRYNYLRTL